MSTATNVGLQEPASKKISEKLCELLADEYFLYLKTLNFHWNITGESFISLHELLESHYESLKDNVDDIAERIRALGYVAPGTYKKYSSHAHIPEGEENQSAQAMLQELVSSHEAVIKQIRLFINDIQGLMDFVTEDMLTDILGGHEKNAWMLRSHLMKRPE